MNIRKDIKLLISQSFWILIIQLFNITAPIVTIPYLLNKLGDTNYGIYAFSLSATQLCGVIVDYGFSVSTVKIISRNSANKKYISEIISAVNILKIPLYIISISCINIIPFIISDYETYHIFFLIMSLSMIPISLHSIWIFQSLFKMNLSLLTVSTYRAAQILLIIFLIESKGDLLNLSFIFLMSTSCGALISLHNLRKIGLYFYTPRKKLVKFLARNTWGYFASRISVASYVNGGTFILGALAGPNVAAIYSICEQLYKGCQALISPISQALYPIMSRRTDVKFFRRILFFTTFLCAACVLIGQQITPTAIPILFKANQTEIIDGFNLFSVILIINIPSVLLGYPFLGTIGKQAVVNHSVIFGGMIQILLLLSIYFLYSLDVKSATIAVLTTETFVFIYRATASFKYLKKS
ncbi:oligosaccharide flippase family protein [Thalassospira sp.]|uniref:oligosaccharide flippase family protein n=1 Tax=Thalassospira sp. TaxID=1912094 RepID=UPI003AA935CC